MNFPAIVTKQPRGLLHHTVTYHRATIPSAYLKYILIEPITYYSTAKTYIMAVFTYFTS